jgi:hypothetical protein
MLTPVAEVSSNGVIEREPNQARGGARTTPS